MDKIVNCPYLLYEPSSCVACTGWFCNAFGRKKTMNDTSMCVNEEEWRECPRYLQKSPIVEESEPELEEEVIELPPTEEITSTQDVGEMITVAVEPEPEEVQVPSPTPSTDCPYLGPVPTGAVGCCDMWCYAANVALRAFKICKRPPFGECQRYLKAARLGVT